MIQSIPRRQKNIETSTAKTVACTEKDIGKNDEIVFLDKGQHESTQNQLFEDDLENDECLDNENAILTTFVPVEDEKTEAKSFAKDIYLHWRSIIV